jgi:hypothetical protein
MKTYSILCMAAGNKKVREEVQGKPVKIEELAPYTFFATYDKSRSKWHKWTLHNVETGYAIRSADSVRSIIDMILPKKEFLFQLIQSAIETNGPLSNYPLYVEGD